MSKTIASINEKIANGTVVVVTAEEIIDLVAEKGLKKAAEEVDVVTTGTFGPMCSSGAYLNIGHSKPRIKLGGGRTTLNGVPAHTGLAAVDLYIGATAIPDEDPRNSAGVGDFAYGGGHVIEDLVAGKDVKLVASAYGTDCYPRRKLETWINIKDINEAVLFNPRNAYQNYNCAVNLSDKVIHTYMGTLKPRLGNANYCSAGQLSPLLNDPLYKTIGLGTRLFFGGGVGYVVWHGTQHNPGVKRGDNGVPRVPAGTLALLGDIKQMKREWLLGASFQGYGATLTVGVGIPIPILNEDICRHTAVRDSELFAPIVDYSSTYPERKPDTLGEVSYAQLKTGQITVNGQAVPTAPLSSYSKALEIAAQLKDWIKTGRFLLTQPVAGLPGADSGYAFRPLAEKAIV
ncbi:MAG TPA: homocysteine biosynthesis protein [Planctomycetota bacterium]|nr:homocysteine biosynthesis protein [Planctomycetota bacterium]